MFLILVAFGLFFLLLTFTGFMFPLFFFMIPLVFLFRRPSVKVYTRTFNTSPDSYNGRDFLPESDGSVEPVIDAEYTERKIDR